MSEASPAKSHATRWIVGVVATVVVYLGSDAPIRALYWKYKISDSGWKSVSTIYVPAYKIMKLPGLWSLEEQWFDFWIKHIPGECRLLKF